VVKGSEWDTARYTTWVRRFGLSCGNTQDKNDWRLRIKSQLANPGGPVTEDIFIFTVLVCSAH